MEQKIVINRGKKYRVNVPSWLDNGGGPSNLGLNASSVIWLTSNTVQVTYNWNSSNELLDWVPNTNSSLSVSSNAVNITGGQSDIYGMTWKQRMAIKNIKIQENPLSTAYCNVYLNLPPTWHGETWNPSGVLGHIWYSGTGIWMPGGIPDPSGAGPLSTNTWYTFEFDASPTLLQVRSSSDGNAWHTKSGAFTQTTSDILGLGTYGGVARWGPLIIEGVVSV